MTPEPPTIAHLKGHGLDFLQGAELYYQAYRQVVPAWFPLHDSPRDYLLCHCLELALKAYLLAKGVSEEDLKRHFGHKLAKLLDAAIEHGLTLDGHARTRLKLLSKPHEEFWTRYPRPLREGESIVIIGEFGPLVEELLRNVGEHLRG
jgi:hypothetical protein